MYCESFISETHWYSKIHLLLSKHYKVQHKELTSVPHRFWVVSPAIKGALMDPIGSFALADGPPDGPLFCQWRRNWAVRLPRWGVESDLMEAFITRFTFLTLAIMAHTSAIKSEAEYSERGCVDLIRVLLDQWIFVICAKSGCLSIIMTLINSRHNMSWKVPSS